MFVKSINLTKWFRLERNVLALCGALVLLANSVSALTITNVAPVNVTPSSFSVIWQTFEAATPGISVYSDAAGLNSLAGQLGVEIFPVQTGNPQLIEPYLRRQNRASLQQKTKTFGHMQVKVTGCQPNTTYYYRLQATGTNGQTINYPASGPLPSVTTALENSFVANSRQLVLGIPGNSEGRIVKLSNTNAAFGLSAVVGDGAGTNEVFFSLSDLFSQIGGTNFMMLGTHEFTAELLGPTARNQSQKFSFFFSPNFVVAALEEELFRGDFLTLLLGKSILQDGTSSSFSLGTVASAPMTNAVFSLNLPTNRFANVTLQPLIPALSGSTLQTISPGLYRVTLKTGAGEFLQGSQSNILQLNFTAVTNQPSAIVRLTPLNISGIKADTAAVTNFFFQQGKVVIIGAEPLVEGELVADQNRALTLYGNPGASYDVQSSTNISSVANWKHFTRVPMTNLFLTFNGMDTNAGSIFYRAYEFVANPPLLEARLSPDQKRTLTIFGQPGVEYELQYTTNLSGIVTWHPLLFTELTNSFKFVENPGADKNIFFRVLPP